MVEPAKSAAQLLKTFFFRPLFRFLFNDALFEDGFQRDPHCLSIYTSGSRLVRGLIFSSLDLSVLFGDYAQGRCHGLETSTEEILSDDSQQI